MSIENSFPELPGESPLAIADDGPRKAMEFHLVHHEDVGNFLGCRRVTWSGEKKVYLFSRSTTVLVCRNLAPFSSKSVICPNDRRPPSHGISLIPATVHIATRHRVSF